MGSLKAVIYFVCLGNSIITISKEGNQSRKKVTDGIKLSVLWSESLWVSLSMNVTHCHVRVTIEQIKGWLGKSIIAIDKRSAVYLL